MEKWPSHPSSRAYYSGVLWARNPCHPILNFSWPEESKKWFGEWHSYGVIKLKKQPKVWNFFHRRTISSIFLESLWPMESVYMVKFKIGPTQSEKMTFKVGKIVFLANFERSVLPSHLYYRNAIVLSESGMTSPFICIFARLSSWNGSGVIKPNVHLCQKNA